MATATTQKFEEMVLETSEDGTTWTKICGMTDVTVNYSSSIDTAEVPDCDDESLPLSVEKSVRSISVTVSATGVWAQSSHELMSDWFYNSERKRVRIGNTAAAVGDTEYETGYAYLTSMSTNRSKGKKVMRDIELEFDGTPTRAAKPV